MIVKKQENLGNAGLVDKVEFLASNMETIKFNIKEQAPSTSSSVINKMQEESNDSTDTFYSCHTNVNTSINTNQPCSSKEQTPSPTDKKNLEKLKRIEMELADFSDDNDDEEEQDENKEDSDGFNSQELRDIEELENAFMAGNNE